MSIKLEAGKYYVARCGRIVGPMQDYHDGHAMYLFKSYWDDSIESWMPDGRFLANSDCDAGRNMDLIEEITDPVPASEPVPTSEPAATPELKIEAGKLYRLRNGWKARIYATDGGGDRKIHGAVFNGSSWQTRTWMPSGKFSILSPEKEKPEDIVAEWVEPPKPLEFWKNIYSDPESQFTGIYQCETKEEAISYISLEVDNQEGYVRTALFREVIEEAE